MAASRSPSRTEYHFAWICALPLELAAASAMLDETYPSLPATTAHNAYTLGRIHNHHIVLTCLPAGIYGTTSATAVVSHLESTFPNLRYGILVGIGGGVPSKTADVRLGDVVVSRPTGSFGGVIQYDFGKATSGGRFQHTGMLNQPPMVLLTAVSQLEANRMMERDGFILERMSEVFRRHPDMQEAFSRPQQEDCLFRSTYKHAASESTCLGCDPAEQKDRAPRVLREPQIHYGTIASGNRVIKDGIERDAIAREFNILCFEMEAAGIMNHLPCLVVRGICDYCDSHKNKQWQGYAALVAAIYARTLLSVIPVNYGQQEQLQPSGTWVVPFNRNPRFQGRDDKIIQLKDQILRRDGTRKAAISGLGGVGKTQIALEVAYQIHEQDPAYSVFWIPSTTVEAIEQAFMNIGEQLRLPDITAANIKSQIKTYLSSTGVSPWLLIIDNADDEDIWMKPLGASSPALKTFLPQTHNGFILFTTRNQRLATRLVGGPEIISLSELDPITAVNLFKDLLIQKHLPEEDQESTAILMRQLCGLPLALTQAASFINETSITLRTYLSLLDQQETSMIELLSQDFEDDYRYSDIKNPIATTWFISFQQIQQSCDLAAEYLAFIACIDARDIPLSLIPCDQSELAQEKALGVLKAYAFITEQTNNRFISMHRLVHLAIRSWLRQEGQLQQRVITAGNHLSQIFPSNDHPYRNIWREYLPHAEILLQCNELKSDPELRGDIRWRVGLCLYSDGRYNEAELLIRAAKEANELALGAKDHHTLMSMETLALVYQAQGRLPEAEQLELAVMEIRKRELGAEHPDTLIIIGNLASIYWNQGRYREAEELEVQLIETRKRVLGAEDPGTLMSMTNLASIYQDQHRYKEAEQLLLAMMEIRKRVLGVEHPDTLIGMSNLASLYRKQGRLDEAEELGLIVMEIRKRVLGAEHPDTLISMSNLALLYQTQGRLDEAEQFGLTVMETRKRVLGAEHPHTLTSMANLAFIMKNQERYLDAIPLLSSYLQLREKRFGATDGHTLRARAELESWQAALHGQQSPPPTTVSRRGPRDVSYLPLIQGGPVPSLLKSLQPWLIPSRPGQIVDERTGSEDVD
ncbi:hypothetical protein ASPZODRAFT_130176 [Penicilliopsis zonata CBS 506.65]|uniref:Nucleoside phosphorylase domain-containing protein n=1 Tax=Penicilliopsis zonata CBS 506.65 TaxID=1073090 RepID=A0A1L9SM99_9EURO|nr:hypothetical protein ASPZODRAFT_130176 [Penicilliopsis zonata CBS 506.65]OJJ48221.1 hypothetical protein ASPZODRAFT_130176 [Penicilliopsis zonata CBS 506.65]